MTKQYLILVSLYLYLCAFSIILILISARHVASVIRKILEVEDTIKMLETKKSIIEIEKKLSSKN